ncbi:cytidylate kinase [Desulfuribacillus stibiiarsenatis]|uniref:Cytidylate kinase n=1 Tax=Desulfuribacillus stibiiarsenatis TaxID=1390249 RepID=A0A1E5L3U4_9FIRM|nr:(d)CMP kinase [Desulfuribacillus stibiiarsenatis]OEH84775.1 cytidylate kinase [Desulfuribacillus stibiiarsenatis]
MTHINIAIDGPAGAGKSTVAKKVSDLLGKGYYYIDTGALYRGITYIVLYNSIDITNERAILEELQRHELAFDQNQKLMINGQVYAEAIRTPEVTSHVSSIAAYPGVRSYILSLLRKLAVTGGVVMDGRDIGSYVLPNAEVKIFLTASLEERAKRRAEELQSKSYEIDLSALQKEIADRDKQDTERKESPLIQAEDAIRIDTTNLTIDEVVQEIVAISRTMIKELNHCQVKS